MALEANMMNGSKKIHPHKFSLWLGMGSICMMFAGLTSAYVVRESQGNWRYYHLPNIFWVSTVAILISSVTMYLTLKSYKKGELGRFRNFFLATLILGILFGAFQYAGFYQLFHGTQIIRMNGQTFNYSENVKLSGNPSESFLYVIVGLHFLHLLGGIVALSIAYIRTNFKKIKSSAGIELVSSYWHFMDALWIYLFIFFLSNQ